jgi:hypothetical protein
MKSQTNSLKDNSFYYTFSENEAINLLKSAEETKEKYKDLESAMHIMWEIEEKLIEKNPNTDFNSIEHKIEYKLINEKKYFIKKAQILYALKHYSEAALVFSQMIKNHDKEYCFYKFEGDCMSKLGEYYKALELYIIAISIYERKPSSTDSIVIDEKTNLLNAGAVACAKIYYNQENDNKFLKQSLYLLNRGLKINDKDFFCNLNVVSIYSSLNKEEYAYFYLKKACQIFKNTQYSNINKENKKFIIKIIKKFTFIQENFMNLEFEINKLEQFLIDNTTTIPYQLKYIKTKKNIELINDSVELKRVFDKSSALEKIKNVENMIASLKKEVNFYKEEKTDTYQSKGATRETNSSMKIDKEIQDTKDNFKKTYSLIWDDKKEGNILPELYFSDDYYSLSESAESSDLFNKNKAYNKKCCCVIQKISIKYDNPLLNNANLFNQLAKKIGAEKLLNLTNAIVERYDADVLQNAIEDGYDGVYNLLMGEGDSVNYC